MRFFLFFILLLLAACRKGKNDPPGPPPVAHQSPKIDSSRFRLGNLSKNTQDTFAVYYNQPVSVNHIRLLSSLCVPDLRWTVTGGGKVVRFYNLLCGTLAEDYRFELSVKDSTGRDKLDSVNFSYYFKKIAIPGEIQQVSVSADNKFCWVAAYEPNKLYCFGLEDTAYRREYSLPFPPRRFAFNRYNQRFYVLPYFSYTTNLDRIYVFNPLTGAIEKTITVVPDAYDDPQKRIVAFDIGFGANGYGVVNTSTIESGPTRWRVIDSRSNDTIYAHAQWIASYGSGNENFRQFATIQPNYNGTRIYLQAINALPRAGVLDCQTRLVTELTYPSTNPGHYLVPSKTHDKLFVASFTFQAILSGGTTWSNFSTYDNRYSETGDFSYQPGQEDMFYYRGRNYSYDLSVIDYAGSRVLTRVNVRPDFTQINATTDGRYIVAKSGNGICYVKTDMIQGSF